MREEFNNQGFDMQWITNERYMDRITAMVDVYRLASGLQPTFSVQYVRRNILGLDDDKPKFKYGK